MIAMQRVQVDLTDAHTLAKAGGMPQITERELGNDTRAIWIGGDVESHASVSTHAHGICAAPSRKLLDMLWSKHGPTILYSPWMIWGMRRTHGWSTGTIRP